MRSELRTLLKSWVALSAVRPTKRNRSQKICSYYDSDMSYDRRGGFGLKDLFRNRIYGDQDSRTLKTSLEPGSCRDPNQNGPMSLRSRPCAVFEACFKTAVSFFRIFSLVVSVPCPIRHLPLSPFGFLHCSWAQPCGGGRVLVRGIGAYRSVLAFVTSLFGPC